jgi:hypothetical protein
VNCIFLFSRSSESAGIAAVLSWTGVELAAGMMCDFYRADYAIGNDNMTFLGFEEHLDPPLVDNSLRHPNQNVSFSHSSYIFPNMSYNDLVHGLSPAQQRSRDLASKIDPIAKAIYDIRVDSLQTFLTMVSEDINIFDIWLVTVV